MAIDRGPWSALVDDDGSNLIGSIWNKAAIKTVLLDPTDAALVPLTAASGAWTPVDASGAALVFPVAVGRYWKLDKLVVIQGRVIYPATSNGALAAIAGLPAQNGSAYGGFYNTGNTMNALYLSPDTTQIGITIGSSGASATNANLSGVQIMFSGVYLTA